MGVKPHPPPKISKNTNLRWDSWGGWAPLGAERAAGSRWATQGYVLRLAILRAEGDKTLVMGLGGYAQSSGTPLKSVLLSGAVGLQRSSDQ